MEKKIPDAHAATQDGAAPASPAEKAPIDRREALGKIGKYGAYIAPAMLALISTKAIAS